MAKSLEVSVHRAEAQLLAHQIVEKDATIRDCVELLEEFVRCWPRPSSFLFFSSAALFISQDLETGILLKCVLPTLTGLPLLGATSPGARAPARLIAGGCGVD